VPLSAPPVSALAGADLGRLVEHARQLRHAHNRPVGLSVRQAASLLGISDRTAARRLNEAVAADLLVRVTTGTYGTGLASEYDLPEYRPVRSGAHPERRDAAGAPRAGQSAGSRLGVPPPPAPYTHTQGGLIAVWRWSAKQGRWSHYGDCADRAVAGRVVARHMGRRSGWWWAGDELMRYVKGRKLRVYHRVPWNREKEQ
jgi:hypothetical protein